MASKWFGGVRVVATDENKRVLMVSQIHEGREIWMLPGGGIEEGEDSKAAAVREVFEETGLKIEVEDLIWHIEEVSDTRGQRFVNYFFARIHGGEVFVGHDPEITQDEQVLKAVQFVTKKELDDFEYVHPPFLKEEIWAIIERYDNMAKDIKPIFRKRDYSKVYKQKGE